MVLVMHMFRRVLFGFIFLASLHGHAIAQTDIEIGYMPILPDSQLFVALEKGWIKDAGIAPKLVRFQNGPAMVQALLAGQLDVAYFGIGPAMVARAKGADIKVVAANIIEQIYFIAQPKLARYFKGDPSTAFKRFREEQGHKAVVTTFPVGSVPETVFQHWLRRVLMVDPDEIQIIYQGAAQVQQALLTGAVDGAAILEPIVTALLNKSQGAKVVAHGSQMFAGQPGAVLAVREKVLQKHPDVIRALVGAHRKATNLLNDDPTAAAKAVQKYVGGGRMKLEIVTAALRRSAGTFVADPKKIIEGTRAMRDFQKELGTLKEAVDVDALIDTQYYPASPR
jgi:NitT/TauT family transport system substrate-binding protein